MRDTTNETPHARHYLRHIAFKATYEAPLTRYQLRETAWLFIRGQSHADAFKRNTTHTCFLVETHIIQDSHPQEVSQGVRLDRCIDRLNYAADVVKVTEFRCCCCSQTRNACRAQTTSYHWHVCYIFLSKPAPTRMFANSPRPSKQSGAGCKTCGVPKNSQARDHVQACSTNWVHELIATISERVAHSSDERGSKSWAHELGAWVRGADVGAGQTNVAH